LSFDYFADFCILYWHLIEFVWFTLLSCVFYKFPCPRLRDGTTSCPVGSLSFKRFPRP
jgi:hypothetical protein